MKSEEISSYLKGRIDENDFPSASYLVAEKSKVIFQDALGHAVVEPLSIEANLDTIYDLASLTKPLITGLLTVMLIEQGAIDPNESIGNLLPDFFISGNSEISINQLLMHTSGLPAWRPFYLLVEHPDEIPAEIARTFQSRESDSVTYSDLNFLTLEAMIEQVTGKDFLEFADDEILCPLGLKDTFFAPLSHTHRDRIAASERGNEYEKNTCLELGYLQTVAARTAAKMFREKQIWGEVHDGNAWFKGGVSGHAGLFSTAREVFEIARQFLSSTTTLLKPETCDLFRTNFTKGANEDRSVGFQLGSTQDSTAGTSMSPESFGHNGFTGTSVWIDPVKDRIFVLLTNRTHGHPLPFRNINFVRREFHNIAVDLLNLQE